MSEHLLQIDRGERDELVRQGKRLEYLTICWNFLEGIISVAAGLFAGSIALVGFGFDSMIEVLSGGALLWRLHLDMPEKRERAEARALKIVGVCFVLLALYISFDAVKSLITREPPHESLVGIGLAVVSLIVMPILARSKRKVATKINSRAMQADSRQTDLCAYLSAILLGGLLLNAIFGWWWSDPVAAIIMVPIITKEGVEALRGETCCEVDECH